MLKLVSPARDGSASRARPSTSAFVNTVKVEERLLFDRVERELSAVMSRLDGIGST